MTFRANPSGISLTTGDAGIAKGMLARGDRQHDIAAWFGVNGGRIAEISTGKSFAEIKSESSFRLPPPGPYISGKDAAVAIQALETARTAIDRAQSLLLREI